MPHHIRVADAPLLDTRPPIADGSAAEVTERMPLSPREIFFLVVLTAAFVSLSTFLLTPAMAFLVNWLTLFRYVVWLLIIAALALHFGRFGTVPVARALAIFAPFVMIGIVSSVIGYAPVGSIKLIVQWCIVVASAAAIGTELRPDILGKGLLYILLTMVVVSIVAVFVVPKIGLQSDLRTEGGAWRGLFGSKNLFGQIAAYALLFALLIRAPFVVRTLGALAALVGLIGARSQGALLAFVVVLGLLLLVALLRRTAFPQLLKSAALVIVLLVMPLVAAMAYEPIIGLLGRDASLTGRTDIWQSWLARASDNWLTGTGPGSFTAESPITQSLSATEGSLGNIVTPHNMFIAAFGEIGIFGLLAFTLPLLYFIVAVPMRNQQRLGFAIFAVSATMVVGGIGETRELFGLGKNMFLLVLVYASFLKATAVEDVVAPDGDMQNRSYARSALGNRAGQAPSPKLVVNT